MATGISLSVGLIIFLFIIGGLILSRYRRCPSDKILVIYGKTSGDSVKCVAGGAAFVWPVIQDYSYLDLSPISIDVDLKNALSKQNIRVNVPSRFTVAISKDEGIMENAAERLLSMSTEQIRDNAKDIIFGQLRLVVAMMDIEEINSDRDKFLANVASNVGSELRKIGLTLINVNITDIEDESGYIEALGKEAAAQAINEAKVRVAERVREGSIGQAVAQQEQRIKVSQAEAAAQIGETAATAAATEGANLAKVTIANSEADLRVKEAQAEAETKIGESLARAKSVDGENKAKIEIADSDALRRIREAEAQSKAVASEKIQVAKALEDSYTAETQAEEARAKRDMATKEADVIVEAEIAKRKLELEAEAIAEQTRREAKGAADAIYMKREAEARGLYEVLSKQADGMQRLVDASGGNAKDAAMLLIADKIEDLVRIQVDAIKNIKIDKVTVWETGESGGNGQGGNATSNFISGLYKAVPPMNDLFNMAGMDLPEYLGKVQNATAEELIATDVTSKGDPELEGLES